MGKKKKHGAYIFSAKRDQLFTIQEKGNGNHKTAMLRGGGGGGGTADCRPKEERQPVRGLATREKKEDSYNLDII